MNFEEFWNDLKILGNEIVRLKNIWVETFGGLEIVLGKNCNASSKL